MPFLAAVIPAAALGTTVAEGAAVVGGTMLAANLVSPLVTPTQQHTFDPTDILNDDDGGSNFP